MYNLPFAEFVFQLVFLRGVFTSTVNIQLKIKGKGKGGYDRSKMKVEGEVKLFLSQVLWRTVKTNRAEANATTSINV